MAGISKLLRRNRILGDREAELRARERELLERLSTALQRVFMDALRHSAVAPGHETDARAVLGDARAAVVAAARRRIHVIGAANRA